MSQRNTVLRSMHDLGMAAWFGGTLMGVVGLNGASAKAQDSTERLRIASIGWGRWAPFQAAAIVTHAIGGVGVIVTNTGRLAVQPGARANAYVKLPLTIVAAGLSLYAGILGTRMAKHADEGAAGTTEPGVGSSDELASAQRQQKIVQWILPVLTGVLIVLGAQQGEQQRPAVGWLTRLRG